jgi:hypothetical protein
MRVLNQVSPSDALLSAWNLEQFNATEETVSFVSVENPRESINFDFYEPRPHSQIAYGPRGFTYQTNGKQRGQIGIHESAKPTLIGFYDLKNNFLCLKENQSSNEGLFFNIADNEQKQGAYSARDFYSIFNSDESMSAFELETIAPLIVENGYLKESTLISTTTFATFSDSSSLLHFLKEIGILGS